MLGFGRALHGPQKTEVRLTAIGSHHPKAFGGASSAPIHSHIKIIYAAADL